ncbi:MAG: excinuclease ABC subunit UvrC [Candidatus Marinimicrobia bacterium]|nr:excinuclease ABC subunit UvrC [Candidatus Neomarinimicrobiota bacterium]MDD5230242.1 excinuclease ABC subunit UvrC [Candidatus Neomarinimicrobiota bacterium]
MPERFPPGLMEKIRTAPTDPGCYIYRNSGGKIIYIGKAKNIRNRVKSYFVNGYKEPKTAALVSQIFEVEFILTNSEIEALILENTLIKTHRPKYNIFFRDDKTYPYVRITAEPFAQVFLTRNVIRDGSKYFGPYTDSRLLRETLEIIKNIFPIRSCKHRLNEKTIAKGQIKICLDYHIKKCEGPCQGLVSAEEYDLMIAKVMAFLNGHTEDAIQYFQEKMKTAATNMQFETAAAYRNKIAILKNYSNRQVVELNDCLDRDLVAVLKEAENCCAIIFRVRRGKLIGRDRFFLEGTQNYEYSRIVRDLILRYYDNVTSFPSEVLVNELPDEKDMLESWLTAQKGARVIIIKPQRGEKVQLLKMALRNAELQLNELFQKQNQKVDFIPKSLQSLQDELRLKQLPRRIEAFDISNIRGKFAVGSMITFINATAKNSEYRRFKIKTVTGVNDYAMMAEVVRRRYTRLIREKKTMPDLILIDGGKGQLIAAVNVMRDLNISEIPIIGLAKRLEEVFIPEQDEPLMLPRNSIALSLLQRVRDEAHRFAINYHRKLRGKGGISTRLDEIPGLSKNIKKELLNHFKTIANIRAARVDDLTKVRGVGAKLAQKIKLYL